MPASILTLYSRPNASFRLAFFVAERNIARLDMESEVVQLPLWQKVWAWFEANRKQAIWSAAILAGVALITWYVVWQQAQKELTASEALSNVGLPQSGSAAKPDTAEAYMKVAATYPKSAAAARAMLLAAGSLFVEGKYTEARTQFDRFVREHHDSPYTGEALLGLAACWDAQGKTNDAITAYKNLVDHHPGESVIPQAKFALARLYEGENKPEQAKSLFEDVNRSEPYSSVGSEAGMRLEELLAKHPELAPKPAPLASAPVALTNAAQPLITSTPATTNAMPPLSNATPLQPGSAAPPASAVPPPTNATPPATNATPLNAPKP